MALTDQWYKSRKTASNGACVEVRLHDGNIQVRDTKDGGTGPVLSFTEKEWDAFLDGAKGNEFDLA